MNIQPKVRDSRNAWPYPLVTGLAVIRLPNSRYVVRDWPRRTRHGAHQAALLAVALTFSFDYQTEPAS